MSKHEIYELKQMQSLPLESKITMTMKRIIDWKEYWEGKGESVYVSWSGGKDSTVLLHIAKQLYPDITRVYVDTGLEYPEIKEFVKKDKDVVILHPKKPFWKVVTEYGYPVISKETSECIDQARKALKSDKYNYRLLKIKGEAKQKNGEKSKYNLAKYKPLLDVPFKISSKCCSIMKKSPLHKYNHKNKSHPKLDWGSQQSRPNNINNNIINNIKKESKKEESFDDIINSMCQNEELKNTLYDFIKMRKVIKKPLTNRALKSIINKVKKLSNGKGSLAIAILDQSITNCWQDVYELRNNNNNNTQVKEPKQDCPYDVKKIGLHFD